MFILSLFSSSLLPLLYPSLYAKRFCPKDVINAATNDRQNNLKPSEALEPAPASKDWERVRVKLENEWFLCRMISSAVLLADTNILRIELISSWEVTRTATLMSLLFGLCSVLCGSLNTILLPTLQPAYETALKDDRYPRWKFWHLWVLITLPVIHLSWAIIQLSFVVFKYFTTHVDKIPEFQPTLTVALLGFPLVVVSCLLYCFVGSYPSGSYEFEADEAQLSETGITKRQ